VISIGGQETQMFLSRGAWLARKLGLDKWERRVLRTDILPVSFGFPFGLSVLVPVNMPLPSKIITEVLEPIDVVAQWGPDPDPAKVDGRVRRVMQANLDRLARRRRLPIFG
jgi:1-acyl-sn-glycerol-3-phosphate acyltransferase